jgi:uncharacterized protein
MAADSRVEKGAAIDWQPWSAGVFAQAKTQHKLVLMDLEAVWCHWCHVMNETTYADAKVIGLVRGDYIAVRVDQDSRPDISARYEDYGWPATVIFKWDGSELAKRQGYIPPMPMASMLKAFADDPTPGPSVQPEEAVVASGTAGLSGSARTTLEIAFAGAYDAKLGGWGNADHYLDWDALEYCLTQAAAGDTGMEAMARQTLQSGLKLIDPVWGGVDQYSTNGDWDHPHYEKIMPFQAESIRIFAMAASLWHDPQSLKPAFQIRGYLKNFLTSPKGAFYTSQDADAVPGEQGARYFALDDAARRKAGVPRVDTHVYARENGLAIRGLAALYAASGDASVLADARRAAEWILKNRALPGGGFRHDEHDGAGPYLGDTLEMGRAFLALYKVTGERRWLTLSEKAADFIGKNFRADTGFATSAASKDIPLKPEPETDENVSLARFANLLGQYSGNVAYSAMAAHAMQYLASPQVVKQAGLFGTGLLLADRECNRVPIHVTVVGAKNDPAAGELFVAALRSEPGYARIEWYDRDEGPMPSSDVQYPTLPKAAAYVCTSQSCSSPMQTADALTARLAKLAAIK